MPACTRLQSLNQFARLGCVAAVKCRCGRETTVDPERLIAFAARKGWPIDNLDHITRALRCTFCKRKGECRLYAVPIEPLS